MLQGEIGHISSGRDTIIPHTLLPFQQGGNGTPTIDEIDTIKTLATTQGWAGIIDKEALGILQMLSYFIDRNVYNGTKNVWVDEIDIEENCCSDATDCAGFNWPSAFNAPYMGIQGATVYVDLYEISNRNDIVWSAACNTNPNDMTISLSGRWLTIRLFAPRSAVTLTATLGDCDECSATIPVYMAIA
jgi:hypothetical protein